MTTVFSHRELTKDCKFYIDYVYKQSPVYSTSHLVLRELYRKWGKKNVDFEVDRLFEEQRHAQSRNEHH